MLYFTHDLSILNSNYTKDKIFICVKIDQSTCHQYSPVHHLLDIPEIGVAIRGADVNQTDEIDHALAEVDDAIGAPGIEIHGHLDRLVEAHRRRAVEHDAYPLHQHRAVLET